MLTGVPWVPFFRQLIALIATILERNPELSFRGCIELSQMVDEAHRLYLKVRPRVGTGWRRFAVGSRAWCYRRKE